jgi:superfamily II DNA or RNA helicase
MGELRNAYVDPDTLQRVVGGGSFRRGASYAQQGAVRDMKWDPRRGCLRGTVSERGRRYQAAAFLTLPGNGGPAKFAKGQCACGNQYCCCHVVAIVLSVPPPAPPAESAPPASAPALTPRQDPGRGTVPVGIEFRLTDGPAQTRRVAARLVERDQLGGWTADKLSWDNLRLAGHFGNYGEERVRPLSELYQLYQEASTQGCFGRDRLIDFSAIGSPQLWPLLADLPLLFRGSDEPLPAYQEGRLHLDVTLLRPGMLQIRPVILTSDGEPAELVAFIGKDGQGALCARPAREPGPTRYHLVRLARPVPPTLQGTALGGQPLEVPLDDFYAERYTWLRRAADLISSDQSFPLSAISGPKLVLRVCPASRRTLEVSWHWAYQIGESQLRPPLGDRSQDKRYYRKPDAERQLLARLVLPLAAYGLGSDAGPGVKPAKPAPRVYLTGQDVTRFRLEFLPLAESHPELIIEYGPKLTARSRELKGKPRMAVSTDEVPGDYDWFSLDVTITVDGHPVPFRDVFLALYYRASRLALRGGAFVSLDHPELHALAELIEEARALDDSGPPRISRFQVGLWNELLTVAEPGKQAPAWRKQVQSLLSPAAAGRTEPPPQLKAKLRRHQQDGFAWLSLLWENRLGGILADEMGLGKTLQCIALINHARQRDPAGPPFLIVAPTSVRANWVREAGKFAPDLTVAQITATTARSGRDLSELAAGADAVVTTYGLLAREFDAYAALNWSGLLLDEAQAVKNRKSTFYKCASRLPAPVKIAITGTPLENHLMEFWALLSITAPGLFPSEKRFKDHYARPIQEQGDDERLAQLRRRVAPLVLRRTKRQAAPDLPGKQEQVIEVELAPEHRHVYDVYLQHERMKALGLIASIGVNHSMLMRSLTDLRQLSLHAGLIDPAHADLPSAKVEALVRQLREVTAKGEQALVFSQFTRFLDKVRARLDAEGLPSCYLKGKTRKRTRLIDKFKAGVPVFLISLKAGGSGLNLTEANHVFLLDPWWNPAVEAQAIDRVHRIGQDRNVNVYRLVAKDTIEEDVLKLQAGKAALFADVMQDDGHGFLGALGVDDLLGLLGLTRPGARRQGGPKRAPARRHRPRAARPLRRAARRPRAGRPPGRGRR